jgi:hypothetical protein
VFTDGWTGRGKDYSADSKMRRTWCTLYVISVLYKGGKNGEDETEANTTNFE